MIGITKSPLVSFWSFSFYSFFDIHLCLLHLLASLDSPALVNIWPPIFLLHPFRVPLRPSRLHLSPPVHLFPLFWALSSSDTPYFFFLWLLSLIVFLLASARSGFLFHWPSLASANAFSFSGLTSFPPFLWFVLAPQRSSFFRSSGSPCLREFVLL